MDVRHLWHLAQQLETRRQQDPQVIYPLIQVYEQMVSQLQPDKDPLFYATVQTNLGLANYELPRGDRGVNLENTIACYQQALHF